MSKIMYCWRAKKDVPMLDDGEWEVLYPRLIESLEEIKRHRSIHGSTIEQARAAGFGQGALDCYFHLTGYRETNPDFLWHYKAAKYGPLCVHCGKPLRTPEAKLCAECGTSAPNPSFKRGISRMAMKTLRRLVRFTLLSFIILFGVVVIAVMFVVIYLSKPYIEVTEMRSTSAPQTVEVRWYISCERDYYYDDENKKHYEPMVPPGGVMPGVGPVMSSDTRFVLVGYPYKALHRNIFTGSVNEQRSERFDVVEWHVVTPYHLWDGEKNIESNKPLKWESDKSDIKYFAQVDQRRKGGC